MGNPDESWMSTRGRIANAKRWGGPDADTSELEAQLKREIAEAKKARLINKAREILQTFGEENGSPE